MLPKTRAYAKSYDSQTKWMYFLFEDDDLSEKCNTTWNMSIIKISWKPKIRSYGDDAIKFHDKVVPKVGSNYNCLAIINLDSALK